MKGKQIMADDCCKAACGTTTTLNDPRWRRALWIALGVNAGLGNLGVSVVQFLSPMVIVPEPPMASTSADLFRRIVPSLMAVVPG